jgi:hypothetical protein
VFEDKFIGLFRLKRKKNFIIHFSPDVAFVIKSRIDEISGTCSTHRQFLLSLKERRMA